ncbi:MAG: MG2 domain-containing protein [Myxococcota bacterium]
MHIVAVPPRAFLLGSLILAAGCPSAAPPPSSTPSPSPTPSAAAVASPPAGPLVVPARLEAEDPARAAEREAAERARRTEAEGRLQALKKKYPQAEATRWEVGVKAYEKQNWKDAAEAFTAYALHHPADPKAQVAIQRVALCRFALGEVEAGLRFHQDAVELYRGTLDAARVLRTLSASYLAVPHFGTKKGGEQHRGRYDQGIYFDSHRQDRASAIAALEEARLIYLGSANPSPELLKERIEVEHELVSAIARFTPFDPQWSAWYYPWGEQEDDDKVDEEGADERAGNPWWRQQQLARAEPRGVPIDAEGRVIFQPAASSYDPRLPDTVKIKTILAEIAGLDRSEKQEVAAQALFRQAMLFRTRDGTERLNRLATWWSGGVYVYQKDIEAASPWTLADDEVLGLIATHIGVYQVPPEESVAALLSRIVREQPKSDTAARAELALAEFHQSRQQYSRAIELYQAFIAHRPGSPLIPEAQGQLDALHKPEVRIASERPQLLGGAVVLPLEHRNLSQVWAKAVRVDQERLLREFKASWAPGTPNPGSSEYYPENPTYYLLNPGGAKNYLKYAMGKVERFTLKLEDDGTHRAKKSEPTVPLAEGGLWVIELYADAEETKSLAAGALMLESAAIVLKSVPQGTLAWVVEAKGGTPIAGAELESFEYWSEWVGPNTKPLVKNVIRKVTTDKDGLALLPAPEPRGQRLLSLLKGPSHPYVGAWYGVGYYARSIGSSDTVFLTTDRPVYRPKDTVEIAAFARQARDGAYLPPSSFRTLYVRVTDPKGAIVLEASEPRDAFGAAHFRLTLPAGAALGLYQIATQIDGSWAAGAGQFRVEEYKPPEFEVKVSAGDGPAKLGTTIPVTVRATYYFGGAVQGGKVHYKAYRSDSVRRYTAPGPWDWLYGPGYGRCYYAYPWLSWWRWSGPVPWAWYPWWGAEPTVRKELVKEGEGVLDGDGFLRFSLDTSKAKELYGDTDQLFSVEAEVTDASRRMIKGDGEVLATKSQFFVHLEADKGYYDTGSTIRVDVRTLLPTEAPIPTEGQFKVARIALLGDNGDTLEERPITAQKARTDGDGHLELRWDAKEAGQYRLSYTTQDAWGTEVSGSAVVWVWGPGFDGAHVRFNHLELWTNQRTYQVGQVARVLVTSDVSGAHVLFSPKAEDGVITEPKVIALDGKTKVIDIPITKGLVPNFFLEATLVAGGKMSQDVREIFVPPAAAEMKIAVSPRRAEQRPGEPAELELRTTSLDGKPISAEVALSVFDRSILYIQPELSGDIRKVFWGQKRTHFAHSTSNLARNYPSYNPFSRPDLYGAALLAGQVLNDLVGVTDFGRADLQSLEGGMFGHANAHLGGAVGLGLRGAGSGGGGAVPAAAPAPRQTLAEGKMGNKELAKAKAGDDGTRFREFDKADGKDSAAGPGASPPLTVRRNFADTAHFEMVHTDASGVATVRWKFPDNLGAWRVRAIGISEAAEVGEGTAAMTTAKRLMVRLETPRFFRERDQVMLSANVHNHLASTKQVKVSLSVAAPQLTLDGPASRVVTVEAGKEARVDFWAKVSAEGDTKVQVTAETDEESDAKEVTLPVLVHGMEKLESAVGSISAADASGTQRQIELEVPGARRIEQSQLTLRWAPSLAGAMLDALPFLLEYPYGCTEQTTSRFVPAAITRRALLASGVKLEDLAKMHTSANPARLDGEGESEYKARLRREEWVWNHSPVYNSALMDDMIAVGLSRLAKMQRPDGGWGWWGSDQSSIYTTAYVLEGLRQAQLAGVSVPSDLIARGKNALRNMVPGHLVYYKDHDWVSDEDAYFAYVMSGFGEKDETLNKFLLERRARLSVYGKSLATLAFHALHEEGSARLFFENASQRLEEDAENETAWVQTRSEGWWWWWNDEIESNATYLRAMIALNPGDPRAPKLVKWLLNHRRNGWYWRSTRDTAVTIGAFADYLAASKESEPDYDLEISLDGKALKSVHVDKRSLFSGASEIVLSGAAVTSGKHQISFKRSGKGAVYFNAYLSTFTLEEGITPAGLELKVERKYWKLVRSDREHPIYDQRGQQASMKEAAYQKVALEDGAELASGDLVLVELMLESKNDYAQLAFEDPRPAGMEPVALRSGQTYGEAVANLELRDDKVVFFLSTLNQGKLKLEYRLRAQIPGQFHAMPTRGFAMYAPEIRGNGAEARLSIKDAE